MSRLLQFFILLPLAAFLASMLIPRKKERIISWLVIATLTIHLVACSAFIVYWLINGYAALDIKHIVLYKTQEFEFFIDFYFDAITAVYAFVGSLVILLVSIFSRYYLHRDEGFKRFFVTLLLFFLGYNLVIFSGNLETLFIGWEILGFCSFLLIAFYRDRYLPVKNGLKVISVYRLGDVCLMLAMWMCHHLFHQNISFLQINDADFIAGHLDSKNSLFIFTAVMIFIAAAAKSALLPFSSWLPRAMEGPTTSSAVFYGSLSVHLGAFLLMRTYPFWENILLVKILVISTGAITTLVATSIARVQSTVKTQIAYSSITQMGLIFIEVALGFHMLALVHFAGNAFLRTYQLLVSPSVLSYEIHDMIFSYKPKEQTIRNSGLDKLKNAVYILSIKEFNIDWLQYRLLWQPFKWIGNKFSFIGSRFALLVLILIFLSGFIYSASDQALPKNIDESVTLVFSALGLLMVLKAFSEKGSAITAWLMITAAQCFITLSIALNEPVSLAELFIYLGGVLVSSVVGYTCLSRIKKIDNDIQLTRFHGYNYEKPVLGFVFLLSCLGSLGFPFTPTFLGIDLLFTHIHKDQPVLITLTALSFIFIELSLLRVYARVFLGQHKKQYHPIAFRSS